MQLALCDRFPSLTPFAIRKEKAIEVFLLVNRLNALPKNKDFKNNKTNVIRRPASDDWY